MSRNNLFRFFTINLVAVFCCQIIGSSQSLACSTFSYLEQGRAFVGKSYDWDKEQGFLYVNKRGVKKSALQELVTRLVAERCFCPGNW